MDKTATKGRYLTLFLFILTNRFNLLLDIYELELGFEADCFRLLVKAN